MPRFVCVCVSVCVHMVVCCCECVYVYEIYSMHVYTMFYHYWNLQLVCIVLQLFPLPVETVVMVTWDWWEAVTTCSRVQERAEWRSASTMPGEQFVALHLVFQMPRWPVMNLEDSIERVKLYRQSHRLTWCYYHRVSIVKSVDSICRDSADTEYV